MPWRRQWQPTPIFLPGEFHGQRSLVVYSPWGPKESDMTEQLTHCVTAPITHWHRNWDTSWPVKKWAWFSPAIGGLYLLPQVTLCELYAYWAISSTSPESTFPPKTCSPNPGLLQSYSCIALAELRLSFCASVLTQIFKEIPLALWCLPISRPVRPRVTCEPVSVHLHTNHLSLLPAWLQNHFLQKAGCLCFCQMKETRGIPTASHLTRVNVSPGRRRTCLSPWPWFAVHLTDEARAITLGPRRMSSKDSLFFFFFFWHVQILIACCVYSGHSILLKLRSPHGLFSLSGWKHHQWAVLQAKKGCCLVGPLCDSQDLGFEDLWSVQCGEVYEPWVVPGKTQLFWMKILILHIAMPQRYLPVGALTNESKWVLTATPQMAS